MSVNYYDKDTGELVPIANGTLYANAAVGVIQAYGGTTAPSGWLLCHGQEVLKADYPELYAVIGDAFGTPSDNTKFVLPDLREATTKGVGLSGQSENHYSENGVVLGEFIEDRLQSHTHGIRNGFDGADPDSAERGDGRHGYSAKSNDASGRTGNTTEVKAVGVNYIIKAKQVAMPIDFTDTVKDLIKDNSRECSGFLINSLSDEITGFGRAIISLKNGIAKINFSARIQRNDMTDGFNWGLNKDLLRNLIPDLPDITPISTNSQLQYFAANGTALIDLMGYSALAIPTGQFWTPARMYERGGSIGSWGSSQFSINSYIMGTVYGTYTV